MTIILKNKTRKRRRTNLPPKKYDVVSDDDEQNDGTDDVTLRYILYAELLITCYHGPQFNA